MPISRVSPWSARTASSISTAVSPPRTNGRGPPRWPRACEASGASSIRSTWPRLLARRSAAGSRGAGQQKGFGGEQVLFGVDADRRLLCLEGEDGDVRLEE